MTVVLATTVVRGSAQGDSHGGAYLVDFGRRTVRQVLDWNTIDIDWQGRGWDRGLRGAAVVGERVFIAASDELFAFDRTFRRLGAWRSPYLKHAHEICVRDGVLFIASTGFDCVLGFDLASEAFTWGLSFTREESRIRAAAFDPRGPDGPAASNVFHLNAVAAAPRGLTIAGLRTPGLLRWAHGALSIVASLPPGTHNAQFVGDGVAFNDTEANVVRLVTPARQRTFDIPSYPPERLLHRDADASGIARQAFGRGLCALPDGRLVAGSSPATLAIHDTTANATTQVVTLSLDVRTAVHGLTVWPFE